VLNNLHFDRADINRDERRGAAQPNKTHATQVPGEDPADWPRKREFGWRVGDSWPAADLSERLGNLSLRKRLLHVTAAALGRTVRTPIFQTDMIHLIG